MKILSTIYQLIKNSKEPFLTYPPVSLSVLPIVPDLADPSSVNDVCRYTF